MQDNVFAKVNGRELSKDLIEYYKTQMGPERAAHFSGEEGEDRLKEEVINQELFYENAKVEGIENDPEFLIRLEAVKEQLLRTYAVAKVVNVCSVSDDECKKYYDDNGSNFVNPETISARHILVDTEEKALELKKRIDDGESFAKVAEEESLCPSSGKGGDLGVFGKGRMVQEFEDAAFSLEQGVVSEPVKTEFGYHLILVENKTPSKVIAYDEIKGRIREFLMNEKQNKAFYDKVGELRAKYEVVKY